MNHKNLADETSEKKIPLPNLNSCSIPDNAFSKLPTDVLSGTDVIDIKHFIPNPVVSIGQFNAEVGGAYMKIHVSSRNQIRRVYQEPSIKDISKIYTDLCIKSGYIYGEDVRGIFTTKGLLWLELKSGHESITPDLWTQLNNAN